MKRIFKKVPAFVIVSLIIVLTVAFTVLAAAVVNDFTGDGVVDNEDVIAIMKSITGQETLSADNQNMADFDGNETIDVLDVIALKNYMFTIKNINDDWTVGIY